MVVSDEEVMDSEDVDVHSYLPMKRSVISMEREPLIYNDD